MDGKLTLRISKENLKRFKRIAKEQHGKKHCQLLREIIVALNENRLVIKPTEEKAIEMKKSTQLYKVN